MMIMRIGYFLHYLMLVLTALVCLVLPTIYLGWAGWFFGLGTLVTGMIMMFVAEEIIVTWLIRGEKPFKFGDK